MKTRTAILMSGRGSNMHALAQAAQAADYPARIGLVISNRPDAEGLEKARTLGLDTLIIDHKAYTSREAFDAAIDDVLVAHGIELVCHAGFMRIQTAGFAGRWLGRQLNIHPSLLPAFKGLHPHKQALDAGVRISGCTVHFVTPELDSGPIVAQAAVAVQPDDSPESLAARILAVEHRLYPHALRLVSTGAARLNGDRVEFATTVNQTEPLLSPGP